MIGCIIATTLVALAMGTAASPTEVGSTSAANAGQCPHSHTLEKIPEFQALYNCLEKNGYDKCTWQKEGVATSDISIECRDQLSPFLSNYEERRGDEHHKRKRRHKSNSGSSSSSSNENEDQDSEIFPSLIIAQLTALDACEAAPLLDDMMMPINLMGNFLVDPLCYASVFYNILIPQVSG